MTLFSSTSQSLLVLEKIIKMSESAVMSAEDSMRSAMVTKDQANHALSAARQMKDDLLTNYFSLVQKQNWSLYQYAVTFKPVLEDSRVSYYSLILAQNGPASNVGVL